jgi:hypothetical protein
VELPLECWPERRLRLWWPCEREEWEWEDADEVWRLLLFLCLRLDSSAGRPWTMPLRASIPPFTLKFLHTMKARMAAFSRASSSDSYARSVWYSRPLTRTKHV